ncbi:hypothetical protein DPEC_G00178990 [Dallia pectoralis]|uniref:Uncharacterized protein n=1 Tax=Dallia pectoralis TaxID=75939 RepID=A0ACC2GFN3_DALPE|nr:hypothetical protein DPEC_G00178990 [Dallia pectoralis]
MYLSINCLAGFQTKVLMTLEKLVENQVEILANQRKLLAGVEDPPEEVIQRSCRTVKELEDLCKGLEDATKRNKMISYLRSVGGRDLGAMVRKVLNKIASNQVLKVYSLKGRKENAVSMTSTSVG